MVSQLFVSRQLRTILCAIDQHLTQKRLQRSAKARSEKHFASWSWGIKIPRNSHLTLCQLCNSPLPWKRNTAKGNFQGEANATQIFKGLRRSLRPKPNFTKPGLFQPRLQAGHYGHNAPWSCFLISNGSTSEQSITSPSSLSNHHLLSLSNPGHVHSQFIPQVALLISGEGVVWEMVVSQNAMYFLSEKTCRKSRKSLES